MACFSPQLIVQFLVTGAILAGFYMIATFLLAKIQLGEPWPSVLYVLKVIMWVLIAIWVIYFLADLFVCLLGSVGNFGRLH